MIKEVVSKRGLPKTIVTDRGSSFTSELWRNFTNTLGIKNNYSTAYHPQTDGQTERVNQILEEYLALYTNYQMDDWSQLLPIAEWYITNAIINNRSFTLHGRPWIRNDIRPIDSWQTTDIVKPRQNDNRHSEITLDTMTADHRRQHDYG